MTFMGRRAALLAATLTATSGGALAAEPQTWTVDHDASRVGFVTERSGTPVEGEFSAFDATIRFTRDAPDASSVEVVIQVASVDAGSPDRNQAITSSKLFHAEKYPQARYAADSFSHKGGDRFVAHGELTMRGTTHPVDLPFELSTTREDGTIRARAEGSVTVERLRWGIGKGVWRNTGMVPNEVTIEIELAATRPAE